MRNKVIQTLQKTKVFMNIIEGSKGNGRKIWQTINKLAGKQNMNVKKKLLKINSILVKDYL